MKELVKFEFRKIWTQLTIISVISLVVVSTALNFLAYYSNHGGINSDGEIITGFKAFRIVKNEAKDTRGVMDQGYLDNLVKKFNSSKEKLEHEDKLGNYLTKYDASNHIANFANYGKDNFNIYMNLDFDFLKSEKDFYNQYKRSAIDAIQFDLQKNWFKYTDNQMNKITEKINKIDTPFKVDYYEGISYLIWQYTEQIYFVIAVVGFALSSLFSKDSNNGIDELTLSSKFGRKKNMNARIIAGNIFAVVVYIIFVGILFIEHGAIGSLQGWNQSIQNVWHTCLYNISLGTGLLIMIGKGLLSTLLVANLVMYISIKVRYSKLATLLSLSSIWLLIRLTYTDNPLQLQLNPMYYSRVSLGYEVFYFIGDLMIPYTLAFLVLGCVYMIIVRVLTVRQYKRYKLN
ncbi:hypothetical protein CHL78_014375 [Romboutsia weinsteinii]|uniref:Uncharacterized protein n=1 Tax=Romboutsia weinsteinii TaxID=2020949 RepID=A0A371J0F1_9FIRM|nr:hypothetical protein [Romboutsia weinsteinii]RDY26282.1 hypothetical protein CHL78_014375 [Romboutsia weinsteinii]